MNLYNLRSVDPGVFLMAKFDKDFNVAAVYELRSNGRGDFSCNCPANARSVVISRCKHRKMMPYMMGAVNTSRFYDPETHNWHQPIPVPQEQAEYEAEQVAQLPTPVEVAPQATIDPIERVIPPLPEGITAVSLENPEVVHNTIAAAVGEPQAPSTGFRRRI